MQDIYRKCMIWWMWWLSRICYVRVISDYYHVRYYHYCKLSDCEFAYLFDEKNEKWLFSPIPYGRDSEMSFTSLKSELETENYEINDSMIFNIQNNFFSSLSKSL